MAVWQHQGTSAYILCPSNSTSRAYSADRSYTSVYAQKLFIVALIGIVLCVLDSITKSCQTLCNPMDCSPPGSSVHGTSQARILEWVANFVLQVTFPTLGLNPSVLCLQRWQADSFPLVPLGKPSLLKCGLDLMTHS